MFGYRLYCSPRDKILGYVHKVISLNWPYYGKTFADRLADYTSFGPYWFRP